MSDSSKRRNLPNRRKFLEVTSTGVLGASLGSLAQADPRRSVELVDEFARPDSAYHGDAWETLTPGHWVIRDQALRRDMANSPDPPYGMLWHREWDLKGDYRIEVDFTVRRLGTGDGHELLGICFGGRSLYEGWHGGGLRGQAAWYAAWRGGGRFGIYDHSSDDPDPVGPEESALDLKPGDGVTVSVTVSAGNLPTNATLTAEISGAASRRVVLQYVERETIAEGRFGLVARGDLDFEVNAVRIVSGANRSRPIAVSNLIVAIPQGTTLRREDHHWRVKFLCLFRSEGKTAAIRVSPRELARNRWKSVPVAGEAPIVTNRFRHHTSVIEIRLPADPSERELYFTVWKDGEDVTRDPQNVSYVGRLPRLRSPYKVCGLSCHAISAYHFSEPEKCFPWRIEERNWHSISDPQRYRKADLFQEGWIFEQARPEAFQHCEDFGFQVLLWEDDIWYLEIPIFPHNVADVYRIIGLTLGGKVQRRMMMRHWNVLNPGDHDFGMDDVKGTEQYAVRTVDSLPQDAAYLRRNFAAVWHLVTADEAEHTRDAPKRYRRWQMPDGDLSLIVTDARLWRTTQATAIWEQKGWEGQVAWRRTDPTRTLLGEEQFAWLEETIRSDAAPLLVVTGLNALHTLWEQEADPTDRVFADYAGFNRVATDRLLRLLSSRDGIVTVYGDVHLGTIVRNRDLGVVECSFGPVARYGGRSLKPGFGPRMQDWDGRNLEVIALYHQDFESPDLTPQSEPYYWNFLDLTLATDGPEPEVTSILRNIIDGPQDAPRGGGHLQVAGRTLGRAPASWLPAFQAAPGARIRVLRTNGKLLRAGRADAEGWVRGWGLVEINPGEAVLVVEQEDKKASARILTTLSTPESPP